MRNKNKFKPLKHSIFMDGEQGYPQQFDSSSFRVRDLEEKQRVLKDRLLLIGENLVETKDETSEKINEIKKEIEILKQSMERMMSVLENISNEFLKFARKEELEILTKQAKMFQPMEFATKRDLEKLKRSE